LSKRARSRRIRYRNTVNVARAGKLENPHVYVIVATGTNLAKIGIAADPKQRLRELQTGCPHPLRIALIIPHGGRQLEHLLHRVCAPCRVHPQPRSEWFSLGRGGLDVLRAWAEDNQLRVVTYN